MAAHRKPVRAVDGPPSARKVLEQYVFGSSKFMEIPVEKLKIDMSYQREQSETLVGRIVARFDENKFEPPTVNIRPDGSYYVVDGGHRTEAARRIGMRTLTCRVIQVPQADEPAYFIDLNRSRRWVTPVQTFKAELTNKNPASLEIDRCLKERGLRVSNSHSPQTLSCTGALHTIYTNRGTVGLCRVLDTVLVWPDSEPRRFAGQLLKAIDLFLHEVQANVDDGRLRNRLGGLSTALLLSRASNRWHGWRANDQRGGGIVDATAAEIQKEYLRR